LIESDPTEISERLPDIEMAARAIYKSFAVRPDGIVTRTGIELILSESGLYLDDPRFASLSTFLDKHPAQEPISFNEISHAIAGVNTTLLSRALRGELIIPDFLAFTRQLTGIFQNVKSSCAGAVASYIPQLARVNPDAFAMAVCTIDGQQFSLGDVSRCSSRYRVYAVLRYGAPASTS
jgi:glutaminase